MSKNKRITADRILEVFAAQWAEEYSENESDISTLFAQNKAWTDFMLKKGGFLNRVMENLRRDLAYGWEYYTIDALYIGGKDLLDRLNLGYPSELHVLIEHENGEHVEEEMWKLIHWRAPLKVLIFYDNNDKERQKKPDTKGKWLDEKLQKLSDMLKEVNRFFPEELSTEYLFLIGARRVESGPIYWRWASNNKQITHLVG